MRTIVGLFVFFIIGLPIQLTAHDEGPEDKFEVMSRYQSLLEKLASLSFTSLDEAPRAGIPYVRLQGQEILLIDSQFYLLAEHIARSYVEEIRFACPECTLPTAEELVAQAETLVRKGWLSHVGEQVGRLLALRYGSQFVYLGSRFGKMAGVLKIVGELMEDALLVVFKMPGAHVLCDLITLWIAVNSKSLNSSFRMFAYGRYFDHSSLRTFARYLATSMIVNRSLNRIFTEFGPVRFDRDLLQDGSAAAEKRPWLHHEVAEGEKLFEFMERIDKQLERIFTRLEHLYGEATTSATRETAAQQISELEREAHQLLAARKRIFEGHRSWTSLFILKPNGPDTLYEAADLHRHFRGTSLWMVNLNEAIIEGGYTHRSDTPKAMESYRQKLLGEPMAPLTEAERIVVAEAQSLGIEANQLVRFVADLRFIFDATRSSSERYLRLRLVEGLLGEVLPSLMNSHVTAVTMEASKAKPKFGDFLTLSQVQWKVGRITYFIDDFVDFLRAGSLVDTRKAQRPFQVEFAMEYFALVLNSLKVITELRADFTLEEFKNFNQQLDGVNQKLDGQRFWQEKRVEFSLLPMGEALFGLLGPRTLNHYYRKKPLCGKLYH